MFFTVSKYILKQPYLENCHPLAKVAYIGANVPEDNNKFNPYQTIMNICYAIQSV